MGLSREQGAQLWSTEEAQGGGSGDGVQGSGTACVVRRAVSPEPAEGRHLGNAEQKRLRRAAKDWRIKRKRKRVFQKGEGTHCVKSSRGRDKKVLGGLTVKSPGQDGHGGRGTVEPAARGRGR